MADYYVDPSLGTDTGAGTLGDPWGHTGNEIQKAMDNITAATAGDTIHVKSSGTVSFSGTNLDFTSYGATNANKVLAISGYTSAAGDGGVGTIDLGGASTFTATTVDGMYYQDLDVSGGTGAYQIHSDTFCTAFRVKVDGGAATGGIRFATTSGVHNCDVTNISGIAVWCGNAYGNYIEQASANIALRISENISNANGNLIILSATGATGIYGTPDGGRITFNTVYNSTAGTSNGIEVIGNADNSIVLGNYVEGFSGTGGVGYLIDTGSIVSVYKNNRWFNCSTGETINGRVLFDDDNSVTTSSGLTAAGSANYIPTSELIGAGYPAGFLNLSGNAQEIDIGAIQKVPSAGSSGGGGMQFMRIPNA